MLRSFVAGLLTLPVALWSEARSQSTMRDRSRLYDDATLFYWQGRYTPNLDYNYRNLIRRALSDDERVTSAGMVVDVPLRGRGEPFAYYTNGTQITISAMSMKFLDDIATASAWLDAHNYQQGTIAYYMDVLKYREPGAFPGGRHPAPLVTLGIPDDALIDTAVDETAQKVLKGSVVFILAHEVGHVVHRDVPSDDADNQPRELAADRFAIDMFRRIGVPPGGIVTLFLIGSHFVDHRGDFPSQAAFDAYLRSGATHPLSGARLRAVAAELRRNPTDFVKTEPNKHRALRAVTTMAAQLDSIAPLFDDSLLQRYAYIVGHQIPLSELRPRPMNSMWKPPVRPGGAP